MTDKANPFAPYFDDLDKQRAGAAAVKTIASPVTPDQAVQHRETAKGLGLPSVAIGSDPDFFRKALEQKRATETLSKAPKTAWWLGSTPENGDLSKDDLQNLAWYEAFANSVVRGGQRTAQSYNQWQAFQSQQRGKDADRSFGELVWDEREAYTGRDGKELGRMWPTPGDTVSAGVRYAQSRLARAFGLDGVQDAATYQNTAADWAQRMQDTPMTAGAAKVRDQIGGFKPSGSWAQDLRNVGSIIGQDPVGFISFLAQVGGESVPQLAAAAAVGAVSRNPSLAAAMMGGASGATEYGTSAMEVLEKSGHDLKSPQGALAALGDEDLLRRAQERGELRGVIIGAMDGLSGGLAGKALANSAIGNVLLQTLAQGAMGAGGEALAQIATGDDINLAEIIVEGLAEFVTAPVEVVAMGGGRMPRLVSRFMGGKKTEETLTELDAQAGASALRQRAPDKFLEALQAQGLGEAELFIPSEAVQEFFQDLGGPIDPEILASWGISQDAWDRAVLTGQDVAVPVSNYAAHISGTDAARMFAERATLNPDSEMSKADADDFNARWRDIMEEEMREIEARQQAELQERADEEIISDEVTSALAGEMTADAARYSAAPVAAFIGTMAGRVGMKPLDLWRRYQVQIIGNAAAAYTRRRGEIDVAVNELRAVRRGSAVTGESQALAAEKDAIERFPELRLARPFTRAIGERGGVQPGSPAAQELAARGVTPKTAPGLFRRGGMTDLDNIPEGEIFTGPVLAGDGNGYLSRDAIFDAIEREQRGEKVPYSPDAAEALAQIAELRARGEEVLQPEGYSTTEGLSDGARRIAAAVDALGLDLDALDNDAVAAALGEADMRGTSFATGEAAAPADPDAEEMYQFAGVKSETADRFQLGRAEAMLAEGTGAELVRRQTGWHRGPDGKMRYEISDADAELKIGLNSKPAPDKDQIASEASVALGDDGMAYEASHPDYPEATGYASDADTALARFLDNLDYIEPGAAQGLRERAGQTVRLSELLDHPALYEAYPSLALTNVELQDGEGKTYGGYADSQSNRIAMVVRDKLDDGQFLSILLHEVQHLVQGIEDFARGATTATEWTEYLRGATAKLGRDARVAVENWKVENQSTMDAAEVAYRKLTNASLFADYEALIDYANHETPSSVFRHIRNMSGWFYASTFQSNDDLRPRADELMRRFWDIPNRGRARNAYLSDLAFDMAQLLRAGMGPEFENMRAAGMGRKEAKALVRSIERQIADLHKKKAPLYELEEAARVAENLAKSTKDKSAFEIYRAAFGEIEARNTQTRQSLTDDQRRDKSPLYTQDVLNEDAIVYLGDGRVSAPSLSARIEDARELFQGKADSARGSIRIPGAGIGTAPTVIQLFESRDLSTFLHESGHLFLEIFQDVSAMQEAPQQVRDDMQAIRDWLGVKEGEKIQTKHHEKWARGFEAYLMQGQAPSLELADAFSRFKGWLSRIYKSVTALGVRVPTHISEVMDRMLASDQAIAEARAMHEVGPLFTERGPAGMSESDWAAYQKLAARSQTEAEAKLLKRTMEKIRREKTKWWKEEYASTRKAVHSELSARPVYKMVSVMANKQWLSGAKAPVPDLRIDKAALVEMMGEGIIAEIGRDRIGGRRAIYAAGGTHPETVAAMFGFDSVMAMIDELQNSPPFRQAVEAETDRRMTEAHGDPLTDGSIEEEALAAIHNDAEADKQVAELRAIGRRLGKAEPRAREYKIRARAMIGAMSVREATRSGQFLRAERKAANEAQAAFAGVVKGGRDSIENLELAYAAKERQVLNHHLYRESRAAADVVDSARKRFRSYSSPRVRSAIGSPHIERIDDLLASYEFKARSDKWLNNREAMRQYIDAMTEAGRENELSIDPSIAAQDGRNHYSRMALSELQGLVDTVKNIENIGRRFGKVRDATRTRDEAAVVQSIKDEFEANVTRRAPEREGTKGESRRKLGRDVLNWTLNADTLLREIDGRKDMGPAWDNIKRPIDEGMSRLQVRKVEVAKAFDQLFSVYTDKEKRAMAVRKPNNQLGGDYSKWAVISLALNAGNADNWQRLTNPNVSGHFDEGQINAALGELTEKDWRFVQSMWDYVNSFWPEVSAKETRVTGVAPKKVEAQLMTTAAPGFVTGGYYPIKYDSRLSARADDLSQKALADALFGGRMTKAQTAKGHTVARLGSSTQPVQLDIGVAFSHVNDVIYDLELNEPVVNSFRVLSKLKDTFFEFGKRSDFEALDSWIRDVAAGERSAAHGWGKVMQVARTGFTFSRLGLNIGTVLLQPTGIAQSFVVVGKAATARGLVQVMRNPGRAASDIIAASPFMAERQATFQRDVHNIMGELDASGMTGGRWTNFQRKVLVPLSFYLMQKVQFYTVDAPTWLGAYDRATREGRNEADARAFADLMVKRSQGSGLISDRGMLERGKFTPKQEMNEMPKLLTALGSYMFAKFNVAYERTMGVSWRSPAEVIGWVADMAMLFAFETALAAVVKSKLPDEDEEEWLWLLKETGLSVMGTMPIVRDLSSALQGFSGGGAGASALDLGVVRPLTEVGSLFGDGEFDRKSLTTAIDAFGIWMQLPSAQTNRVIKAFFDEEMRPQTPSIPGAFGLGSSGGDGRSLIEYISGN